ncbi:MAG: hypothetical protein QOD60_1454 [Solirubrobacterales bacterium]|nr:hypothetical protein [Solirubrobacterales bacterium]
MHLLRTKPTGALVAGLAVAGALACTAAEANGATTRPEFVAQSEALCKTTNDAISARSHRLFRKYKRLRPKGRFSQFTKAQRRRDDALFYGGYGRVLAFRGRAVHALDRQLQLVPEPPDDAPLIAQWIESRRVDAELIKDAGQQVVRVSRHKPRHISRLLFQISSIDDQLGFTDLMVGGYGFDQCFLTPEGSF